MCGAWQEPSCLLRQKKYMYSVPRALTVRWRIILWVIPVFLQRPQKSDPLR